MSDAFGRALLDHHRGERTEPLLQRDGEMVETHPIEEFYFGEFEDSMGTTWLESRLEGPLLDIGSGAGRDTLYFQERFETVAIEVSEPLVTLLEERGVEDARRGDMFRLREAFSRDRFRSALAVGTQLGLSRSMQGLRRFLGDLAYITGPDGAAIVDCYDPTYGDADELFGYPLRPGTGTRTPGVLLRIQGYSRQTAAFPAAQPRPPP